MDKGFDFSALLRMQTHENKHKVKPTQFISVAGGVKKRVESNIEKKRKTRLTHFDSHRNLPQCEHPVQEPLSKMQQRMLLLQKWKEEKEKKKKEAMATKKKPFVVGIAKSSLKFEPPPPVAWPLPSTSGRVTRSQSRTHFSSYKQEKIYTFAPKNAAFNPMLRDLDIPSSSIFGQEKLDPNKKQTGEIKSPNVPKSNAHEPRSLRSRTKVTDSKETQNPSTASNAMEKNTTKKKLAKKPLKEVNTIKSKAISSPTPGSTYDSHEECVKKTKSTRKDKKSGQTPKKDENRMIITVRNNKKLLDISNDSTNMETDFEKPSDIRRTSTPKTVTPNKTNPLIEDFITFTPKNPVPKSESSSEEKLRSPKSESPEKKTPQQIEEEARKISPRVCLSRGKENERREMKKRLDEGLLDADVCDMTVEHFRNQLDSEIKRMTEMCETWDKILEQMTLPDEIQEAVLSAVGQARLLMSQKFEQFASLLRQSENPEPGHQLVTTADLQGFWDMVFLQVENVDIRFKKLEESRARGWSVEERPAAAARPRKPSQSKPAAVARVRPAPSNRLRDIIAAARKAKQASTNDDVKTFDAGFFSVRSPVQSPRAATPLRQPSLLQSVLSSEAKKSAAKNLYAVLRASMIGRNVDSGNASPCEANLVSLTPINLGMTPGKSILKSNNNTSTKAISKQLQFAISSSDTTSDSSPNSDDGRISGVNRLDPIISPKLQDSDDSQRTNPTAHNLEKDHLQISDALAYEDNLATKDKFNFDGKEKRHSRRSLRNAESNSVETVTANMAEGKENRRSSRRSLHNAEGNSVTTDEENMAEDKENGRSSRRSLRNAEGNSVTTDEENMAEDKENGRSSRRSLRNAEGNSVTTDEENMAEDNENRRSSRKSLRNAEGNAVTTDEENMAEDKENRPSRRSLHYAEGNSVTKDKGNVAEDKENRPSSRRSARLQRQDAEEIASPVKNTRSRRKAAQTPASENSGKTRSSRRNKSMLEGNEEMFAGTPTSTRSRRRI